MKKNYIVLLATFITAIGMNGCKKVLDKQDLSSFTVGEVFADSSVAKLDMDYIYSNNQPGWYGNDGGTLSASVTSLSEETAGSNVFTSGTATIESVTDIGSSATTTTAPYYKLNTINNFIQNMNAGTLPLAQKRRFNAQAYFWRAYRYFELARVYGGVPLVLAPLPVVGTAAKVAAQLPRNSTTQTFAQIVSDLDSAVAYLPGKWPNVSDYGRLTSGAAAAFLGRVLLTYASPQFNPTHDNARWQAAYDMNTKAISILTLNGYGLAKTWDYTMWTKDGASNVPSGNPEPVMVTGYNTDATSNGANNETYDNSIRPKYLGTSGGSNTPSYDISLAFPMADGLAPTVSTKYPYTLQTFYKNRDPRFYQTIAYNGCNWPIQVALVNGTFNGYIWTYFYPTSAIGATLVAKSTESSASASGFYLRKGADPALNLNNIVNAGTDWVEIRYAEVVLNLAECAAELGKLQEAQNGLIAIRTRAKIEPGTNNQYGLAPISDIPTMVNAVMNEREIELAFEGKRFWDLRRRKLLESTLNGKMRSKMVVTLANTGSKSDYILSTRDVSASTPAGLDALYSGANPTFIVTAGGPNSTYSDTAPITYQGIYFYGIPTASIKNNPNLAQTLGWPGGTFDPLK